MTDLKEKKPAAFYAPRPNRALIRATAAISGGVLRAVWDIRKVEISSADLQRLAELRDSHVLFVANHPTMAEPAVLFQVFARARLSFYLLTAWDTMTAKGSLVTRLLQALGCYSVRRGRRDRGAMETTSRLLAVGQRVLSFPEGQTHGLNDELLPFQPGVLLMALHAVEIMEHRGVEGPLWLVPLAVKYVYQRPMLEEIDRSLGRLDTALGLPEAAMTRYARLRRIALALVERREQELGLPSEPEVELNTRIETLRSAITLRLGRSLGTQLPADADAGDVVQLLANAYHDHVERDESQVGSSGERAREVQALHELWLDLKYFVAVRDGYVSEHPSPERFCDVLSRLELEVLGKTEIRGPRRAIVRVGEPVDLRPCLAGYRSERRETLIALTDEAERAVMDLVTELGRKGRPDNTHLAP